MDKDEQKPAEEKPNTEIPPPTFSEIEKGIDSDNSQKSSDED